MAAHDYHHGDDEPYPENGWSCPIEVIVRMLHGLIRTITGRVAAGNFIMVGKIRRQVRQRDMVDKMISWADGARRTITIVTTLLRTIA